MTTKLARRAALQGAVAALLFPGFAFADAAAEQKKSQVLAKVTAARVSLRSLVGPFSQVRTVGLLSAKVRSTGTLRFVRPDRLRWELAPPDDVIYWVTPEALAYKGRGGSGVVHGTNAKAAAALDDLRVMLGGDLSHLSERYDLVVSGPDDGPFTFDATPKAGVLATVAHLTFTLAPDAATPVSATIVEGPKDKTEILFGVLAKNTEIDPVLMRPPL